jgi:hypothetical protein
MTLPAKLPMGTLKSPAPLNNNAPATTNLTNMDSNPMRAALLTSFMPRRNVFHQYQ